MILRTAGSSHSFARIMLTPTSINRKKKTPSLPPRASYTLDEDGVVGEGLDHGEEEEVGGEGGGDAEGDGDGECRDWPLVDGEDGEGGGEADEAGRRREEGREEAMPGGFRDEDGEEDEVAEADLDVPGAASPRVFVVLVFLVVLHGDVDLVEEARKGLLPVLHEADQEVERAARRQDGEHVVEGEGHEADPFRDGGVGRQVPGDDDGDDDEVGPRRRRREAEPFRSEDRRDAQRREVVEADDG
mmetsp:Transcript_28952/g.93341  ORF Transcript_28952/g.93341 Transcript_28952/m.93341 type:complete len:244 (+) Transcript_28952:314-1045(+)